MILARIKLLAERRRVNLCGQVTDGGESLVLAKRGDCQRSEHSRGAPGRQQSPVNATDIAGAEDIGEVGRDRGKAVVDDGNAVPVAGGGELEGGHGAAARRR